MKKYICIVCLFLFCSAFAQAQQGKVILKNGSTLRGKITADSAGHRLQLLTADGSIWVFDFREVEKTEAIAVRRSFFAVETGVLTSSTPGNVMQGRQPSRQTTFSAQFFGGYLVAPFFVPGISAGADFYPSLLITPVTLTVRGDLSDRRIAPFYQAEIGHGSAVFNNEKNGWSFNGGFTAGGGIGVRVRTGAGTAFTAGIGYKYQEANVILKDRWSSQGEYMRMERIYLRTGFCF